MKTYIVCDRSGNSSIDQRVKVLGIFDDKSKAEQFAKMYAESYTSSYKAGLWSGCYLPREMEIKEFEIVK